MSNGVDTSYFEDIETPNFKDENQWRAGGTLYNEKNAGGFIYNPTYISTPDEKPKLDTDYNILNGRWDNELNTGYVQVKSDLKGGEFFDLFSDSGDTVFYQIGVTISSQNDTQTLSEVVSFSDSNFNKSISIANKYNSFDAVIGMFQSKGFNLMGANPISLSISVLDLAKGDNFQKDFSNLVGASLYSTVKSVFSGQITSALASTLGITDMLQANVIGKVIGELLGEALEVATGYDRSFGFGGEYIGTNSIGVNVYGKAYSIADVINDTIAEITSFGKAETDFYNGSDVWGTDYMGNPELNFASLELQNQTILTDYYEDLYYGEGSYETESDIDEDWNDSEFGVDAQRDYDGEGDSDNDNDGPGYGDPSETADPDGDGGWGI